MKRLREVAEAIAARLHGDGNTEVTGVASITSAAPGDLVFVEQEKYLRPAIESQAAAVITAKAADRTKKPLLISDHPKLAFARAARFLLEGTGRQHAVRHPSAIVHQSVKLGPRTFIGENAVLEEGVQIGENSRIGAGCVIGAGVEIGKNCEIYPRVTIYSATTLQDRVIVHAGAVLGSDGFGYVRDAAAGHYEKFPQVGRLVIEDDVEIGANATIDRGALDETRIGRGSKIDNLVHIGHNCRLGENVIIAAQTGISGSAVIENGVVLGGQVGIADHVRLEEGVIVGAQGGVPSSKILRGKGVVFWGTPARPIQQYLKQLAALAKLGKR
ncbi:MAG TPA: UDP-3-O-(3-hydroxymyristoyl)glucosamine N-acyltransferase [Candidatus Binatia bacterium]|nr:UDP-3-O-(3-hydroxymyristoyl)glucosamine N-acyltransferase [Candidatus Binatia bacterium]